MGGGGGGGRSRTEAIMREIERLRAEREELDGRIRLFESQLRIGAALPPSLSAKAEAMGLPPAAAGLTTNMINRYSCHLLLPDFGIEGQRRLSQSSILVVGAGGLGSPVAMYLAASGVGCLGIVDGDDVELDNLHRQISDQKDFSSSVETLKILRKLNKGITAVGLGLCLLLILMITGISLAYNLSRVVYMELAYL